jgi:tripartite-type tricarboxylate transporter receptor subunit TctC
MITRRILLASLAATSLALMAPAQPVFAQSAEKYPDQMVRFIIPFSAGSMTDILARALADKLATKWKQQVIVENRPGIAGTAAVAKMPADGLTLMLTSNGHAVVGALNKSINFDPVKDFAGVSLVAAMPSILTVPPEGGMKTLADLIAAAKAKPGALNYSSAGLGSATNIAAEVLKQSAGINVTHVPYKGMPDAQTSVIRGDAAMGFTFFNVGGDLIQAGRMRALAVTGTKRMAQLPDVPTFAEAGLTEFNYDAWFGIMAPAATPKDIVAKISRDVAEILAEPEMVARFSAQGVNLVSSPPEKFDAIIRDDTVRFGKLYATGG